ncbi:MAG: hypothetical protein K8T89_06170 [Planctomycetes bacterium]|nr:hypothetical protein [Planctomycetota bacterium]
MLLNVVHGIIQVTQHLISRDFIVPFQVSAEIVRNCVVHDPPVIPFLLDTLDLDAGDAVAFTVEERAA